MEGCFKKEDGKQIIRFCAFVKSCAIQDTDCGCNHSKTTYLLLSFGLNLFKKKKIIIRPCDLSLCYDKTVLLVIFFYISTTYLVIFLNVLFS